VDAGNALIEERENNNKDSLIFAVGPAARPDLDVTLIQMTPALPTDNDSITFSITVQNIGTVPAAACSLSFRVGSETPDLRYPVPGLKAGQTHVITRKVKRAKGDYLAVAVVDTANQIQETDETNNSYTHPFTVSGTVKELLAWYAFNGNTNDYSGDL